MANNRMYLVYRPTGDAVYLGKRLGSGWSGVPGDLGERLQELFNKVEAGQFAAQDDFAIALEVGSYQPHVIDKWRYKALLPSDAPWGRTIVQLEIDESVPYGKPEEI